MVQPLGLTRRWGLSHRRSHYPVGATRVISSLYEAVGLDGAYGRDCSLRKTWGHHARQNGIDLTLIMHQLNHNDLACTKRYLGITDDELEAVSRRLNL